MEINPASSWTWIDHLASGLLHYTNHALLKLAFATGTRVKRLAKHNTATRRFILQKARYH